MTTISTAPSVHITTNALPQQHSFKAWGYSSGVHSFNQADLLASFQELHGSELGLNEHASKDHFLDGRSVA